MAFSFSELQGDLLSIKEASVWASDYLGKNVTPSNISYLVQYGRVKKLEINGNTLLAKNDLITYYNKNTREETWKVKLGDDLNWALSFEQYKESETTKHVHRLHPYKGKFIPQLVEYFIDNHVDEFKKEVFFNRGDIILDPFAGSGTTLVQACEMGINAIGIDISRFNSLISNVKLSKYNLFDIDYQIRSITKKLEEYLDNAHYIDFESELMAELSSFNNKYFPSTEYKYKVNRKEINEKDYGEKKEQEFLVIYNKLLQKHKISFDFDKHDGTFFNKWYFPHIQDEINLVFEQIKQVEDITTKKLLSVILSRTIRSCRATKHADLATLIEPINYTYYCSKHGKICKPLFTILRWWKTYSKDTIKRISDFAKVRTNTSQICLTGDSRTLNIEDELKIKNPAFYEVLKNKKIAGIFSSPPYVGLIDYHEQHAYAYELFGFERNDELEIGPLFRGQGKDAQQSYIDGISEVLCNCSKYFIEDYNVFLVANDKYNMYPTIAKKSGMQIVNTYKRPVLNRTEKDKNAYSEIIFHLKKA